MAVSVWRRRMDLDSIGASVVFAAVIVTTFITLWLMMIARRRLSELDKMYDRRDREYELSGLRVGMTFLALIYSSLVLLVAGLALWANHLIVPWPMPSPYALLGLLSVASASLVYAVSTKTRVGWKDWVLVCLFAILHSVLVAWTWYLWPIILILLSSAAYYSNHRSEKDVVGRQELGIVPQK